MLAKEINEKIMQWLELQSILPEEHSKKHVKKQCQASSSTDKIIFIDKARFPDVIWKIFYNLSEILAGDQLRMAWFIQDEGPTNCT